MKTPLKHRNLLAPAAVVIGTTCSMAVHAAPPPQESLYRQASAPVEKRVEDLLARMTTEEKIGQLLQIPYGKNTVANNVQVKGSETTFPASMIGSYIGASENVENRNKLQKEIVENSRLGIPAIFGLDVIHGFRTCFPVPLAQSCSFDPEAARAACAVAAKESKLSGVDWTFAPMVDIARDPRWGRITESFGEDPYVSARFSEASVLGYQSPGHSSPLSIVACLKHFVGYGASEAGIDYAATDISDQSLQEIHLPSFEAGVKAGAGTVMSAFNTINGIPASGNRRTLTDILRGQLGFQGYVVSDYNSILQLGPEHARMTANDQESARTALHAGVDMDMADCLYAKHLPSLLASGAISKGTLDEAVRRVLRVKFSCGLFERPYAPVVPVEKRYLQKEDLELSRKIAADTFVLLKNDKSTLPLKNTLGSIALVGPFAEDSYSMLGCWHAFCKKEEAITIRAGLESSLAGGTTLHHSSGKSLDEARKTAEQSEVIVLCLGDNRNGENVSLTSLDLPKEQIDLANAMFATGKPVILLLSLGRPMHIAGLVEKSAAVMAVWHPGTQGGLAVADVLLGKKSPSGKLSFTWPLSQGQIPIYYARLSSSRPFKKGEFWVSHYWDSPLEPLYPFGHGLSYSTFKFSEVSLSAGSLGSNGEVQASVTVTNTGNVEAAETVMWYLSASHGSVARPIKQLRSFEKHRFAPGESRTFRFAIQPLRDISYPDTNGRRILEKSRITVSVNNACAPAPAGSAAFDFVP